MTQLKSTYADYPSVLGLLPAVRIPSKAETNATMHWSSAHAQFLSSGRSALAESGGKVVTSRIMAELLRSFRSPLNNQWPSLFLNNTGEPCLSVAHEGMYLTIGKNAFPSCSYFMISFFKSTGLMLE